METKHKNLYETPAVTIVEVKQNGVICASAGSNAVFATMEGTFTEEII